MLGDASYSNHVARPSGTSQQHHQHQQHQQHQRRRQSPAGTSSSAGATSPVGRSGEATCAQAAAQRSVAQRVAVVGGSLAGLAVANVFEQLPGFEVDVFERSDSSMENKGSGLGFVDVHAWQQLRKTRMMRRGQQAHRSQGAFYYGDLWQYLYEGLPQGVVRFGRKIEGLGEDPIWRPTIDGTVYDLAVLADGGWSALRKHVTATQPDYAGYVVWRGMVDAAAVPGFNSFGVFKAGIYDTIVMPLAGDRLGRDVIVCGVFIATPETEARPPQAGTGRHAASSKPHREEESTTSSADKASPTIPGDGVPSWFLPFFRHHFSSQASGELVRLFDAVVRSGKLSAHPQYDYAANSVQAGRLLVVGDAAHMASPRTAVGAHTAILDALALQEAFRHAADTPTGSLDIDEALKSYAPNGAERAARLLQRSQEVGRQFVPTGGLAAVVSPQLSVGIRTWA